MKFSMRIFQCAMLAMIILCSCATVLWAEPVRDAFVEVELISDKMSIQPGIP